MKLVFAMLALCACDRQLNPEYCAAHPDDLRCGPGVDAPLPCAEDVDCPGQVCDTAASMPVCVDCTATKVTLCAATAPVCAADNHCRGCASDDECASEACLPDGSCAAEADIVYVTATGTANGGCGARDLPCAIMQSINEVTDTRKVIKLLPNAGQDYQVSGGAGLALSKDVTVVARGASFSRTGNGPILTVGNQRTVTILGGVIKGGIGSTGHGIACLQMAVLTVIGADIGPNEADGINDLGCGTFLERVVLHNNDAGILKIGGSLEVSRSVFQNNLEGGIDLTGTGTRFSIVNNSFWMNGVTNGPVGGIRVDTDTSTTSRLEFNSFNANRVIFTLGAALHCVVPGFTARNNVMFGNGDTSNMEAVAGTCSHTHSIVAPGALPVGAGNKADDPLFLAAGSGDLRTMPGSPTEGAGDPAADLTGIAATDVDGDPRTAPPDIGIDEHP